MSSATDSASAAVAEAVSSRMSGLNIASGSTAVEVENAPTDEMVQGNGVETAAAQITSAGLSKLFRGNLLENFTVDNSTYSLAQIRATFYPKFENEKSDQEVQFYSNSVILNCLSTVSSQT
jgi:hypothetical protein